MLFVGRKEMRIAGTENRGKMKNKKGGGGDGGDGGRFETRLHTY